MGRRQGRGRKRIPISHIQKQDNLYATFSKRRLGLYNKTSELSTLCGVDIGVIIFSPTGVPYSFFHPTMESVVNNPNRPQEDYTRIMESTTRARINALNRKLDEALEESQRVEEKNKYLQEMEKTRQRGWWEEARENLNMEQVRERIEWFQAFKAKVESRITPENCRGVGGPSTQVPSAIGIEQFLVSNYYLSQHPSYANQSHHLSEDPSSAGLVPNTFFSSSHEAMDDGSGGVGGQYMYDPHQDLLCSSVGGGVGSGQLLNPLSSLQLFDTGGRNLAPSHELFPCPSGVDSDSIFRRYRHIHPLTQHPYIAGGVDHQGQGGNFFV